VKQTSDPNPPAPIAWLLLRDGHAIPITGLAPDDFKTARWRAVKAPEASLQHRRGLDAIVDRLGFRGDFGDYTHRHWPQVQSFLRDQRCGAWRNLFPSDDWNGAPFYFGPTFGPSRRKLADRVFVGDRPVPSRVFLGVDVDWRAWDDRARELHGESLSLRFPQGAVRAATAPPEHLLIANRHHLFGQWDFLDDGLVAGDVREVVDRTYHAVPRTQAELDAHAAEVLTVVRAFRAVFPENGPGWVDLLRPDGNDRLLFLRAQDGTWDLIWRDLRAEAPPPPNAVPGHHSLHPVDLPELLASEQDLARRLYFRQGVWDEQEAHLAEQHFYDVGHTAEQRRMTSNDEVRHRWLVDTHRLPVRRTVGAGASPPPGFHAVRVLERTLFVSDMITVGEYRAMLAETGYLDRRAPGSEDWNRANDPAEVPPDAPVGATWHDAQAFCAWKERSLGLQLCLPTLAELRALRPFHSQHYKHLSAHDFPWEKWPPRPLGGLGTEDGDGQLQVPSAVIWSEPRFHDPEPDRPELPAPGGWTASSHSRGRKRRIEDFPPRAAWRHDAWAEHGGLRFIDAWDAYEWAQEQGQISGRFWEGGLGVDSWGAYKNVKVGFRVVIATP
jgi:Sulfatase-modifying factor enzyme 1